MAIYELREYTAVAGRFADLVTRFRTDTFRIFARVGIEVVFIASTEVGERSSTDLVYVCKFESYADLQDKWATFMSDPEWRQVKRESELNGPLVEVLNRRILNSAAFDQPAT